MPYPLDMVYIKLAGKTEIVSIPLFEAVAILNNASFDYNGSKAKSIEKGVETYVFKGDTSKEKNKVFVVPKEKLRITLEADIYDNNKADRITDLAIQPMDELLVNEVKKLIEIQQ